MDMIAFGQKNIEFPLVVKTVEWVLNIYHSTSRIIRKTYNYRGHFG